MGNSKSFQQKLYTFKPDYYEKLETLRRRIFPIINQHYGFSFYDAYIDFEKFIAYMYELNEYGELKTPYTIHCICDNDEELAELKTIVSDLLPNLKTNEKKLNDNKYYVLINKNK